MAYERVNWKDAPETDTPVTAANLNKMDKGIAEADEAATKSKDTLNNLFTYDETTAALTINLDAL